MKPKRTARKNEGWIDDRSVKTGLGRKSASIILFVSPLLFSQMVYLHLSLSNSLSLCVCAVVCMYHVWQLYFYSTMFHIYIISTRRNQRADRCEAMSCCVYSNMLAILAAFILQDQSKLPSQECRLGNTCNICTLNWMVFQH